MHGVYDCSHEYKEFIGEVITICKDIWLVRHSFREYNIIEDQNLIDQINNTPYNSKGSFNKTIDFKGKLENLFDVKLDDMIDSYYIDPNELYNNGIKVDEYIYYPYKSNFEDREEELENEIIYKVKENSNLIIQRIFKRVSVFDYPFSTTDKYMSSKLFYLVKVEGTDYQILLWEIGLFTNGQFWFPKELHRFIIKRQKISHKDDFNKIDENWSKKDIKEYIHKFFM